MVTQDADVRAFFREYEQASKLCDLELIASQYARAFLMADPGGTRVLGTDSLKAGIQRRKSIVDTIGPSTSSLISVTQTKLDDHYVLAKTEWLITFTGPKPAELTISSTYILYTSGPTIEIVFYLAHQNLMELLKAKGLLAI